MVEMGLAPTIHAASFGIQDSVFLMLLALIVFGPRRLPEIGRQIGKLMYEFRKVSNDFKFQMEEELRASEEAERQKKLQAAQAAATQASVETALQPVAETAPLELSSGSESAAASFEAQAGVGAAGADAEEAISTHQAAPAVEGEVRGEPWKAPQILPPSSGETVAAQKPFRGRVEASVEASAESAETFAEPINGTHGQISENPPASSETATESGQEVHHA